MAPATYPPKPLKSLGLLALLGAKARLAPLPVEPGLGATQVMDI